MRGREGEVNSIRGRTCLRACALAYVIDARAGMYASFAVFLHLCTCEYMKVYCSFKQSACAGTCVPARKRDGAHARACACTPSNHTRALL